MFDTISLAKPTRSFHETVRAQLCAGAKVKTIARQHGVPVVTIRFIAAALSVMGALPDPVQARIEAGKQ
ncbi:hypothetical protein [Paracoccus sp. KR1-242]|uniref:hypothetical protein n=1 Tax=Paracoccus sp. KR1-242 TaxID=3410028 RepID=UPI003C0EC8F1